LGKLILTKSSDILLSNHKSKLELQNKDFQHNLDLRLDEFNIQFSKLHQERAEIIKQIYYDIIDVQSHMSIYLKPINPNSSGIDEEKHRRYLKVNEVIVKLINSYRPNKIYLAEGLAKKMDLILEDFINEIGAYTLFHKLSTQNKLEFFNTEKEVKTKSEMIKLVDEEFPKIIQEIEKEFRKLLGVK